MEKCCELAELQAPAGSGYYYYVYRLQGDDTWYYENYEVMTNEEPEFQDERTEENCSPPAVTCNWGNHNPPDVAYQNGGAITCEDYNASIAESGVVVWTPDLPATDCKDVEEGNTCTDSTATFYPEKSCTEETCDEMAGFSFAEPP